MPFSKIFQTTKERERAQAMQERLERRKREGDQANLLIQKGKLERAISSLEEQIDKRSAMARKYLSEGRRERAERELVMRKRNEVTLRRYLNLQSFVESSIESTQFLATSAGMLDDLKQVAGNVAGIDGVSIATELGQLSTTLNEKVRDVSDAIDAPYMDEYERMIYGDCDGLGSVQDEMRRLEAEIASSAGKITDEITAGKSEIARQTAELLQQSH